MFHRPDRQLGQRPGMGEDLGRDHRGLGDPPQLASPKLDEQFRALFAEMARAWRSAPEPDGIFLAEVDRAGLADVGVVAIIHGWMARLVRTGEAALLCDEQGYGEEASPLIRSMLEHAIGLWWLVDQRGDAFQALARSRSNQMKRLADAQKSGWSVGDAEAQALLQAAISLETDEASKSANGLLAVAHQSKEYGLGAFFQAWLVESWTSHASLASAKAYYWKEADQDDGLEAITLLRDPQGGHREVAAAVALALHTALVAYDRLLAEQPLSTRLTEWQERFEQLGSGLAAENVR